MRAARSASRAGIAGSPYSREGPSIAQRSAARAAERWAIDGPSREYGDPAIPARDAERAARMGYDGKLLIHPAQLAPVRAAFTPSAGEIAYARRVVEAAARSNPAVLDGTMIDPPIEAAAHRILRRAGAL